MSFIPRAVLVRSSPEPQHSDERRTLWEEGRCGGPVASFPPYRLKTAASVAVQVSEFSLEFG